MEYITHDAAPQQDKLRTGCPITRDDCARTQNTRQAMLDRGYLPLAVHSPWSGVVDEAHAGKQPLTDRANGRSRPWTKGHSRERLLRVTPLSANTGLLLGGPNALAALDIDPAKASSETGQIAFIAALVSILRQSPFRPYLKEMLWRTREPASLLGLARADHAMDKSKISGTRGAVELLGQGQQCVVDGYHPRSLHGPLTRWKWRGARTPWSVPVADLPVIPATDWLATLEQISASGVLGDHLPSPIGNHATGQHPRVSGYEATARLHALFDKHNGLVKPAIRELVEQIGAEGRGRHDAVVAIAGRIVMQRWSDAQALEFLAPLVSENFGEGDWSGEILAALRHARTHEAARLGKQGSVIAWAK